MSRDLRPVELYLLDISCNRSLRNITSVTRTDGNNTGTEILLQNSSARQRYPELSFLFSGFRSIYEAYGHDRTARQVFKKFEQSLVECETDMTQKNDLQLPGTTNDVFFNTPIKDIVREWFYGRLDKNFYYSDENNYQFEEYMRHSIESELIKQLSTI